MVLVPLWSKNGYRLCPFWSGIGYGFQGNYRSVQSAKKVASDSLGLVDFAIGLVIFVLN